MTVPTRPDAAGNAYSDDVIDLGEIILGLWHGRWWILGAVAAAVLLGLVYLNAAEYRYRASMTVIPVTKDEPAELGGGISSLAGLAGVSLSGLGDPLQFQLFLDGLTTRETAQRLAERDDLLRTIFAGDWNADAGRWEEPGGLRRTLRSVTDLLSGYPRQPWRAPDAVRVESFIREYLSIEESSTSSIVTIAFEHRDREFAMEVLELLHATVDDRLRARSLARSQASAAYLRSKLEDVRVSEVREALAQALSAREQELMLASSSLPFAADPVSGPTAPEAPSRPVPVLVLALAVTIGLLVGIALALLVRSRADPL